MTSMFSVNPTSLEDCPLCDRKNILGRDQSDDCHEVYCHTCGQYRISEECIHFAIPQITALEKSTLSAITKRNWVFSNNPILLTTDKINNLKNNAPRNNDVAQKSHLLLHCIAHKSTFPGSRVTLTLSDDYPVCFACNSNELRYYCDLLVESVLVRRLNTNDQAIIELSLTAKGWEEVSRTVGIDSPNAFVAMSFNAENSQLREIYERAIAPAIEAAGYRPIRIDRIQYNGDIVFEIIARIKESRFVVADVTEHKNGVYFEGGYAMGLGLPVIWTCENKDLNNVHFDTKQLNHILWEDADEFKKNLTNRILATIGRCRTAQVMHGN